MPFSSGTFTYTTAGLPVVTGTTISSTVENAKNTETATGLTTCLLKDGTQTVTANIPMSTFKFTGLGVGSALTDSASITQVQNQFGSYLTSVAGTNTVTATATPTPAYAVGQRFTLIPAVTNTGAVTLNISAVGAGAVQWAGAALTGGEFVAGAATTVVVTATTPVFEIVAPLRIATGAEMESGSSSSVVVTPSIQQRHQSAAKAWVNFNSAGTVAASFNITSVLDNAVGNWTVNIAIDFSSSSYAGVVTGGENTSGTLRSLIYNIASAPAAGTFQIFALDGIDAVTARDPSDPNQMHAIFFGDQ